MDTKSSDITYAFDGKLWHILLGTMIFLFIISPTLKGIGSFPSQIIDVVFWVSFGALALRCRENMLFRCFLVLMISCSLLTSLASGALAPSGCGTWMVVHRAFSLLTTFLVFATLLHQLFLVKHANSPTITCSICAYLALALTWTNALALELFFHPGSLMHLVGPDMAPFYFQGEDTLSELFYFSISTLTSVGYGDIVPANSWTRLFCSTEAIMGQFYVAVVIARVVSIYINDSRAAEKKEPAPCK